MSENRRSVPDVTPETKRYWEATATVVSPYMSARAADSPISIRGRPIRTASATTWTGCGRDG